MDEPQYSSETSEIMNKLDSGEITETSAKEKADGRLALTPSALLARIEGMDVRKVAASTQYGMGLVIVTEGAKHLLNGIAYRNDEMTHADRVSLAEEANAIIGHNAQVEARD